MQKKKEKIFPERMTNVCYCRAARVGAESVN